MRLHARGLQAALLPLALCVAPASARAQRVGARAAVDKSPSIEVGSAAEDSLRALQTLGLVPLAPWSSRGFSAREARALRGDTAVGPRAAFAALPLRERGFFNSAFPYGFNDGAVWQGRGVTTALDGGVSARAGWVSVVLAPVVFWSQNAAFPLMSNGDTGTLRFANARFPTSVDLPQRFGDAHYARFDPGQSTLRVDAPVLTAGISTANLWWGPMTVFPYILGDNAAGFVHVFLGTSSPVSVGVGRLSARVVYGRLDQSAYTSIPADSAHRFGAGAIFVFEPRGLPGLEIGAARFFHTHWPDGGIGWAQLRKPFEPGLKVQLPDVAGSKDPKESPDNQLLSAFARWVLPHSGFELYGEFGRDDHAWNTRDLIMEPDHSASLGIGFRKAWWAPDSSLATLTGEAIDYRPSALLRRRGEGGTYEHPRTRQGHTNDGQLLGAPISAGTGAGSTVAYQRRGRDGGFAVSWTRLLLQDEGSYWKGLVQSPRGVDVMHALMLERTRRVGVLWATVGAGVVYELNRDYRADATNLRATMELTWQP